MAELVSLQVHADVGVGEIRLQRPPMNAISSALCRDLVEVVDEAVAHDDVRALVVWGGPKVFAAGADIKEFPDWGHDEALEGARVLHRAMDAIAVAPMATIAAISGYALGGGFELALACDFRVAADNAKVGFPEITLGLIPGAGGTQRLARLVGPTRAKELVFSGRMVDMTEAPDLGLVQAVVPADDLFDHAVAEAARFAAGPYSLRLAKRAIDEGVELPLDEALALEQQLFADCFDTEDKQIGVASFIEHGPGQASFVGR
jgi:enoyl-CoA hydratase/carnithine racemase